MPRVPQSDGAGHVGTDEVAGHDVEVGSFMMESDSIAAVGRDDVALDVVGHAVAVGADQVPACPADDMSPATPTDPVTVA